MRDSTKGNDLQDILASTFSENIIDLSGSKLSMSIRELSTALFGENSCKSARCFFEDVDPDLGLNPITIYKNKENFRKVYLKKMKDTNFEFYKKLITTTYYNYLKSRSDSEYHVSSIPSALVERYSILEIKRIFRSNLAEFKALYSLPRYKLVTFTDKEFEDQCIAIQTLLNEGVIDGIDISGSIEEKSDLKDYSGIYSRLKTLGDIFVEKGVFKVHMFESSNKGTFYDEIDMLISYWKQNPSKGPKTICVGHIYSLSGQFISEIKGFVNDKTILFEANIFSNLSLHPDGSLVDIFDKIKLLIESNLPVCPGGDGAGLLNIKNLDSSIDTLMKENLNDLQYLRYLENLSKCKY